MSAGFTFFIDGLAFWTPAAPGWEQAQAALGGRLGESAAGTAAAAPSRPNPPLLTANERRRASDSVLVALQVASAACADAGHEPAITASVFSSAHGDLPITHALCQTLAHDPRLLSPTRFHHSVHNAASGYWAIASGCTAASTALSAGDHSFAAGLLEAASQCVAEDMPVLLVTYDTEACGPLVSVNRSRGLLGVALLLAPERSARTRWQMRLTLQPGAGQPPPLRSALARSLRDNASSDALPLFEALASHQPARLALTLHEQAHLALALSGTPEALTQRAERMADDPNSHTAGPAAA